MDPGANARPGGSKAFVDENHGLDDGEETQANIFETFFNARRRYPGPMNGAFFWDNEIATYAMWAEAEQALRVELEASGEISCA